MPNYYKFSLYQDGEKIITIIEINKIKIKVYKDIKIKIYENQSIILRGDVTT